MGAIQSRDFFNSKTYKRDKKIFCEYLLSKTISAVAWENCVSRATVRRVVDKFFRFLYQIPNSEKIPDSLHKSRREKYSLITQNLYHLEHNYVENNPRKKEIQDYYGLKEFARTFGELKKFEERKNLYSLFVKKIAPIMCSSFDSVFNDYQDIVNRYADDLDRIYGVLQEVVGAVYECDWSASNEKAVQRLIRAFALAKTV